jgi:hypothetical protein
MQEAYVADASVLVACHLVLQEESLRNWRKLGRQLDEKEPHGSMINKLKGVERGKVSQ